MGKFIYVRLTKKFSNVQLRDFDPRHPKQTVLVIDDKGNQKDISNVEGEAVIDASSREKAPVRVYETHKINDFKHQGMIEQVDDEEAERILGIKKEDKVKEAQDDAKRIAKDKKEKEDILKKLDTEKSKVSDL